MPGGPAFLWRPRMWLTLVMAAVAATLLLDGLQAGLQQSSYYFSESFLFSSCWWIWPGFLYLQGRYFADGRGLPVLIAGVVLPTVLHLLAYPALVWLLSALLMEHTFSWWQTFTYAVPAYGLLLAFIYSGSLLLFRYAGKKLEAPPAPSETRPKATVFSLTVTEGPRTLAIALEDVLYFSANPPYTNIHTRHRRHLRKESLQSLLGRLDTDQFVRIHKSVIVNLRAVKSYQSRSNGDYDCTLEDGTVLRVSRTYAPVFRSLYAGLHRDTD